MFKLLVLSALVALSCAAPRATVPRLDGRIIGGEDVNIEDYPYQLSLQYYGSHICGASIISEKYAVTAAHCTVGSSASSLSVRAGSTSHASGGVTVQVGKIFQNPKYNSNTYDYDISVLELETSLNLGKGIQKIDLPSLNQEVATGADAYCTGWGTTIEGIPIAASTLKGVTLQITDREECDNANYNKLTDRMLCANVNGGGKDACQGDSGGPLVVNGQLVGIVSWGYGCARPDFPGVYSSVPNLRNYITENAGI